MTVLGAVIVGISAFAAAPAVASPTIDPPACYQPSSGNLGAVSGVENCAPTVGSTGELPVGLPDVTPDTSDPVNSPPAPPNVDDTVVPQGVMPQTDATTAGLADSATDTADVEVYGSSVWDAKTPLGLERQAPDCDSQWHYDITKKLAPKFAAGQNKSVSYINDSPHEQVNALEASSTKNGHIDMSASAEIQLDEGLIVASVHEKYGVTVSGGVAWSATITGRATVGANSTGTLTYGTMRFVTVGHYYHTNVYCQTDVDKGALTVYSPTNLAFHYVESKN